MADYQKIFYLQLHDRRLPQYQGQSCQDCNSEFRKDSLCTFTTAYFTNDVGYDLKCPFQTQTRTVTRYNFPNTHEGKWY